ncbi:hypothetical protein [Phenylobacterium sp.]|uniref:hypothetical protein n=1 Tax=Phenylobacterium sp. TaxID=1871053 RepID=UPI003BAD60C4
MFKTLILAGAASVLLTVPALAQGVAVPGVPVNGEVSATTGVAPLTTKARVASGQSTTHGDAALSTPGVRGALDAAALSADASATMPRPLRVGDKILDRYGLDAGRVTEVGPRVTIMRKGKTTTVAAASLKMKSNGVYSTQRRTTIWKR